MVEAWRRQRSPDDVPTPVAVAVSDFCRRAGAPASPAEIRDALSLLADDEDFRVRSLTDSEPKAKPLGPFAVVDVLRGTPEALAATRQQCGYYDLARSIASIAAQPQPVASPTEPQQEPPAPAQEAPAPTLAAEPKAAPAGPARRKDKAATIAERIAPTRRPAAEVAPREPMAAIEPEHPHGSEAAKPKGRFARIAPQPRSVDELFDPEAREMLQSRIEQYPDRFALTRGLGEEFGGRREGQPLRTEDLERALRHHGLLDSLERKEREAVLAAFTEQRGALSRAAFALGLTVPEMNKLVKALELSEGVEEIRERFRREALSPKRLAARLDLLGRGKYLSDLGIRTRFDDALRADLRKLADVVAPEARDARDLIALAARREGTQEELLARAYDKLGLTEELRKRFPDLTQTDYLT